MPPTANQTRMLEHVTSAIHDLREDLAQRITEGNSTVTRHLDRLSDRVDAQGERLSKVEARVEHLSNSGGERGPSTATQWKRDGALVLSGGGILAIIDTLVAWIGMHFGK